MDNLTEKLTQILNDTGSLQQIINMASALGMQDPQITPPAPDPDLAEHMTEALHHAQAQEQKQQALVHALLPYLRPGRQARLERAMQIAHLSHLAGAALRSGVPKPNNEEGHRHV